MCRRHGDKRAQEPRVPRENRRPVIAATHTCIRAQTKGFVPPPPCAREGWHKVWRQNMQNQRPDAENTSLVRWHKTSASLCHRNRAGTNSTDK